MDFHPLVLAKIKTEMGTPSPRLTRLTRPTRPTRPDDHLAETITICLLGRHAGTIAILLADAIPALTLAQAKPVFMALARANELFGATDPKGDRLFPDELLAQWAAEYQPQNP